MPKANSGFVYLWYDRKHKRFYIGSHWGSPDDGYICSSQWMRRSYKNRPQDFKRRILSIVSTNRTDLLIEEQRWLDMIKPEELRIRYYNLMARSGAFWHTENDEKYLSIKEKISIKTKEAMARPDVRKRYLNSIKNIDRCASEETLKKRSESMKKTMAEKFPIEQRKHREKFGSEAYCQNMSEKSKERWADPEYKKRVLKKIREGNKTVDWSKVQKGLVWWNDGTKQTRSRECPGQGWERGRLF